MPDRGEYQIRRFGIGYIVQASLPEDHAEILKWTTSTAKHDCDGVGNTSVGIVLNGAMSSFLTRPDSIQERWSHSSLSSQGVRNMQLVCMQRRGVGWDQWHRENTTDNSRWKPECTSLHPWNSYLSGCSLYNQYGRKSSVPGRQCRSPPGTNSQGVHGAAANPDDGVASLLSRPQPYWASLGSDRQSSEETHQSAQYPSGSEAFPPGSEAQEEWNALTQKQIRPLMKRMRQRCC